MTTFKIRQTKDGKYYFSLHFKTRFLPAILYGYKCSDKENCFNEIKATQEQILNAKNPIFTRNKKGYDFTIFSLDGNPVAHSRIFPARYLMKRILIILQIRICSASVQIVPGSPKLSIAA